jgi:hypothetical protein
MSAARDERDVGAGGSEPRAEISADAASAENRDAHDRDANTLELVRLKADTTDRRPPEGGHY